MLAERYGTFSETSILIPVFLLFKEHRAEEKMSKLTFQHYRYTNVELWLFAIVNNSRMLNFMLIFLLVVNSELQKGNNCIIKTEKYLSPLLCGFNFEICCVIL